MAVVLIAAGAATGAALCQVQESVAVAVAALVVLAVAVMGHVAARSGGPFITSDTAPTRPSRASAQ